MRQTRHITVAVPLDLYLQSRRLAAEYDTTITAMVAYLLERLPKHLKNAGYPVDGPRRKVLGPADLAREEAEKRTQTPPPTPPPSPHPPRQEHIDFTREAATTPATHADSTTSAIPLDEITATVRQYDGITTSESAT